ncbi:hypothetical protein GOODEAATRI_005024 [Goodea atripinnis]|uniref:GH84 domain-containing protein n=1 Tax=Goodea atripinnis TaxID=208336 RepID=A0ABV0N7Z7_9TELE
MTHDELRERFSQFGEVECVSLHFRDGREQKWGLNTYLYAPKDDYKHRMYWRELYSPEEAATQHVKRAVIFQVRQFGCRSFSLLFDDIEREMCPADKEAFSSFAHAQVAITNEVYQHLGDAKTFLFCPTGPKVVSHKISVESIEEVTTVLKRAPVIWDNIHANDYDPQRLFLGPYKPEVFHRSTNTLWGYFTAVKEALTLALSDWLQEFMSTDQPGGACRLKKELSDEEPMQTDVGESPYVPGPGENPLYTAEPLTMDDLNLLSDLFYLPYEHGAMARIMLEELDWLKNHRQDAAAQTEEMFNRLSNAPNRSVLYDLYNYICDIKSGVGLARTYVKRLDISAPTYDNCPLRNFINLTTRPDLTNEFLYRKYFFFSCELRLSLLSLALCSLSSGEIAPSPQCALVVEDDIGVCGYALGLTDAKQAAGMDQVIKTKLSV